MANLKINMKGVNYDLDNEIKSFIQNKIKHCEKFLPVSKDEEVMIDVLVGKTTEHHNQGEVYKAEIMVKYKSEIKHYEHVSDNLKTAIEKACDEVARQIKKTKERKTDLVRRGASKVKSWLRFGRK